MSLRKYKSLILSGLPAYSKLNSHNNQPISKYQLFKIIFLYLIYILVAVLICVFIFPTQITLAYLTTIATIRHTVIPERFTGNYAKDPYQVLRSYYRNPEKFSQMSTNDKCSFYYKTIFPKTNWKFDTFDNEIYWLDALREKYELLRDREKKGCEDQGKTFCETWFKYEYLEKMQNNLDFEKAILNTIPHYKFFNKCFLDELDDFSSSSSNSNNEGELGFTDRTLQLSQSIEDKLFPWFSKKLIDYKNLETNNNFASIFKRRTFHSYVKNMKHSYIGKGIAISASNDHFRLLSGLIALLRIQGNTLPVEIIYRDDLSTWNQEDLMEIATTDELLDNNLRLTSLFEQITEENSDNFEHVKSLLYDYRQQLQDQEQEYHVPSNVTFPKQDIRFVNAKIAINDQYQGLFQAYSNKLIAFYFSSFKEVLLMDSDTVPLINPEKFFENPKYTSKKAFFFRDREINEHFPDESITFFKNLLPNKQDSEYFGLKQISEESLGNNRFLNQSLNHLMESGIVVIDKFEHYNGALLTLALQSWKPISQPIHGEKELYWLGQLIASDEDFEFNKNYAISLGKLTRKEFSNKNNNGEEEKELGTKANELCSTHPGHISDDDQTLYWMNSGFEFCKKKNKFKLDLPIDLNYYSYFDADNYARYEKMADYYKEPLRINAALIPPSTKYTYNNTKPWFEPSRSWVMTQKCEGYLWCAYDLIGGGDYEGDQYKGKVVNFDSKLEKIYDFYGDIWMHYYNLIF